MFTVLVPTDLSYVGNNAARYAAEMFSGQPEAQLILYHVYEKETEAEAARNGMDLLREELRLNKYVKLECQLDPGVDVTTSLERAARHHSAQLIVMGITGKTKLEQAFLGSNTLKIVERNVCPVLIVPPTAQFRQIKNVALATDFKHVQLTIPLVPIKTVLEVHRPQLHIVNVNDEHYVSLTEPFLKQRDTLAEMFREFRPEFHFIRTYDFEESILRFVTDKEIDILITIPRRHSFFHSLFKGSHTKHLAYESAIPLLAAHE